MKAVLYTSVLQTPILLIGSIAILVIGLTQLGGWGNLMEIVRSTDATYLNDAGEVIYRSTTDSMGDLIRSHQDPKYPWTGVLLGSAIIGFWYWCTDQFIVQRVLSGRDQKQARRGTIFGAYLKLTPVLFFLVPGMIAFAMKQQGMLDFETNDAAFSTLVKELLPKGFTGIVVGGILAALMSSLASLFNSSSMLFTVDFYERFKPNASQRHYVIVGRIATVVIVVLGILWIPVMKGIGKVLYEYLQDVQSVLAPGIAAVFLLGVISKKTTPTAGFTGLVVGFSLGMLRLALNVIYKDVEADGLIYRLIVEPNWLHYEIAIFVIIIALMIVVSYFTKPMDPTKIQGLYFGSATPEQRAVTRASWGKWDVIHSVIIIGFIIAFYIYFW
jgi:SSS family solute:Na+ symporter